MYFNSKHQYIILLIGKNKQNNWFTSLSSIVSNQLSLISREQNEIDVWRLCSYFYRYRCRYNVRLRVYNKNVVGAISLFSFSCVVFLLLLLFLLFVAVLSVFQFNIILIRLCCLSNWSCFQYEKKKIVFRLTLQLSYSNRIDT